MKTITTVVVGVMMIVATAAPAFADSSNGKAAPGNSDFLGGTGKTSQFAPASSPGNS